MKVAIHQPNYLPWCGFFAKLTECDIFVILDDAPISNSRTYVSRTKIREGGGERWLTVPTIVRGTPPIRDIQFADERWREKHLASLRHTYSKAPHLHEILALLEPVYADPGCFLSAFNQKLLTIIAEYLGVQRKIILSSSLNVCATGDDRLIEIVRIVGGTSYVSGKGGQNYQDPKKFAAEGIDLDVKMYSPISYQAPRFPFIAGLSIVDALFILGRKTVRLLSYDA